MRAMNSARAILPSHGAMRSSIAPNICISAKFLYSDGVTIFSIATPAISEAEFAMTIKKIPPAEYIHKILRYDPKTGRLFWRWRPASHFKREQDQKAWNVKWAGKEAFNGTDGKGYLRGTIDGQRFSAHRIIWTMMTGEPPVYDIDHIDGDKLNNRFSNLRHVPHADNMKNLRLAKNNKSGFKGASFSTARQMWCAQIRINKKQTFLGAFHTPEEAHAAYCEAAAKHYGEFARFH